MENKDKVITTKPPKTLADRIKGYKIKIGKGSLKIPKLKVKTPKKKISLKNQPSTQSIINILLKSSIEEAKKEKKEKQQDTRSQIYKIIEEAESAQGGYGTTQRVYGTSPRVQYTDYSKLFSHIGKFRTRNAYENSDGTPTEAINKIMGEGNKFYLVDREIIDEGVRFIKYFTHGALLGAPSAVPMGNINSADWEKFKLWMVVDYVMFNLKMRTT